MAAATHATRLPQSYIQQRACTVARLNDNPAGTTRFHSSPEEGTLSWVIMMSARLETGRYYVRDGATARKPIQNLPKSFQKVCKTAGWPTPGKIAILVAGRW